MKIKFLALLVAILALLVTFSSFVKSLSFTTTPLSASTNTSAGNQPFNFTIKNENSTANITQVNITLPENFNFISSSNNTNATSSSFNYDSSSRNLTWKKDEGLVNASSATWFSFNTSVPFIFRAVNLTVTTLDNSSIVNATNISIAVVPEAVSTSREFGLMPKTIYLNWTNSYQSNFSVLSNSSINISVDFYNNNTPVAANYSQESPSYIYLRLFNKTHDLYSFNNTNYTIIGWCWNGEINQCKSGRYSAPYTIENTTNSAENATITVVVDNPISISSANGIGSFNGTLPKLANESQSFYFDRSSVPNATSIVVNITFNKGDLDVFLLTNDTIPKLLAKSINKTGLNEVLSYNFIKNNNITYEIRIYGNTSDASGISYNGTVILTSLNSTQHEEINYGTQSITNNIIQNILNITNEGNISINNVIEDKQFYYVKRFYSGTSNNFSVFVPDSSIVSSIIVKLNWTGDGAYNISLFNQSNILIANSSNKFINANISNVEKEEFLEIENNSLSEQSGTWRIEVKNTTSNTPGYNITFQAFVDVSKWITTNFSSYINKTFDIVGTQNATKYIQVNFTTPNTTAINGSYEGFLIYRGNNGGQIKIPLKVDISTPVLVVNDTMNRKEVIVQENYNATLTRNLYLNISNYGNDWLNTSFLSSGNLNCSASSPVTCTGYNASLIYNSTTLIPSNDFSVIQVNISFNNSMPKNSLYEGWLYINSTNTTSSNWTSHPYSGFNISIKLNLTDWWNVTIIDLKSGDWGNETINVSSKASWANVTFNIKYVNDTNVTHNTLFNYRNITNVWLFEPNASYYVNSTKNLDFVRLGASDTETIAPSVSDWGINLTVPANIPGGRYNIHINLTSVNLTSDPTRVYRSESLDNPANKQLVVYSTGLNMTLLTYPPQLWNGTNGIVNVTIKNFGPLRATDVKIKLIKCAYISSVTFLNSNCLTSVTTDEVTFTLSAYNSTGCYVAWNITAGGTAGICTSTINGTSGNWFSNLSFLTTVSVPTTTTTVPGEGGNITATTTTTTISTTTTTTIPVTPPPVNVTANISLITPQTPAIFNFTQPEILKFQKIVVAVNKNVSNVAITVKEGEKPTGAPNVTKPEEGLVLKYLEILPTNITDADIANVTIDFQVEKSWITTNNIDVGTIALYRYLNNTWNKLPTKKINETANETHFQSISPGLSVFAIAGEKSKGFPWWIIFLVLGIIVIAVLAFLFWPVEEKKEVLPFLLPEKKEAKKEESPWEELKKKWEELTKKKES
jgi:PGF-pre-PGF domain-containing protein